MLLGVNIDHVATLRQVRLSTYPDPVTIALLAEKAGADSITLHLREDRRHIQEYDLANLSNKRVTKVNLEIAVNNDMLSIVDKYRPEDICLVPENRQELTTEGGLDVVNNFKKIKEFCHKLMAMNCRVSLFVDPIAEQIDASQQCEVEFIEIHTGRYANSDASQSKFELNKIKVATQYALALGLKVNAGHGLNLDNLLDICSVDGLHELNIGHALISDSLTFGITETIRLYKSIISNN